MNGPLGALGPLGPLTVVSGASKLNALDSCGSVTLGLLSRDELHQAQVLTHDAHSVCGLARELAQFGVAEARALAWLAVGVVRA